MELARRIAMMLAWILLPLAAQLWDRRHLDAAARERAWNTASWVPAVSVFGPASMLGWFFVTRRGLERVLGVPATAALVLALFGLDALLEALAGDGR